MQYLFTSSTDYNTRVLSVSRLKEYLRIDHSIEDSKIEDIIDQVIETFQKTTGYIFRPGTLDLVFDKKDNVSYEHYKERSFADRFSRNNSIEFNNYFIVKIGANITTQKPSSFSFTYDDNEKRKVLTESEINTYVPDNFFVVMDKYPLTFKLIKDISSLQEQFNFDPYNSIINVTLNVLPIVIPLDIKACLTRMASAIYENPDIPIDFTSDNIVNSTYHNYNLTAGL